MPTPTYDLIATTTLASTTSFVHFSGIPTTWRDLILTFSGTFSNFAQPNVYINGDFTNNYYYVDMQKSNTSTNSSSDTVSAVWNNSAQYDTGIGQTIWHFLDYSATNKHKTVLARTSTSRDFNGIGAYAVRWANTSAITNLSVSSSLDFQSGGTFALYGIVG